MNERPAVDEWSKAVVETTIAPSLTSIISSVVCNFPREIIGNWITSDLLAYAIKTTRLNSFYNLIFILFDDLYHRIYIYISSPLSWLLKRTLYSRGNKIKKRKPIWNGTETFVVLHTNVTTDAASQVNVPAQWPGWEMIPGDIEISTLMSSSQQLTLEHVATLVSISSSVQRLPCSFHDCR